MKLFKRPARLEKVPFADQCERVCIGRGHLAHLLPPGGDAVLCRWPGARSAAGASLPLCRLCVTEAEIRDMRGVAS